MNAIVSSADTAADPFAAQEKPSVAASATTSGASASNSFDVSGTVNLNSRDADSTVHPNIVRAVYQGDAEGKNKDEERYIVHASTSGKSYSFKTEAEARAFVSYVSATARQGKGATLEGSNDSDFSNLNLGSWDMLSAAGGGDGITGVFGQKTFGLGTSIKINNHSSTVYEVKPEVMEQVMQFDYQQFAGTGIPSLPSEAAYYLQNVFKTIPNDKGEFGVQMAALSASAHVVYDHNGYSDVQSPPPITLTDANLEKLVQAVFGPGTVTNAGHLNTLRLLGLATAGEGGADNHAGWTLSDKGTQIQSRLETAKPDEYIPSLALAALRSPKQFVLKGNLDVYIKADAAGTLAFATKTDGTGTAYTFADVQEQLQSQYGLLNPDFQGVPPKPLPEGLLERSPEVQSMLEAVFGTSFVDESHVNAGISAGLLTYTDSATNTGNPAITTTLTITPKGTWLQQQATAATAAAAA